MKNNRPRILETAVEICLPLASFGYNAYKYPNPTAIAKWFIYLTNWKMMFLFGEGIVKINVMRKSSLIEADSHSEPLPIQNNDLETPLQDNSHQAPSADELKESKQVSLRIITLNMVLTADLLYWILDRSWDDTYLSVIFHSLDLAVLSTTYLYSDTPMLSHPQFKNRLVSDHVIPCLLLVTYALFYGLYQGVGNETDQVGNPPYAVLDYHGDASTRALTYVYSAALPFVMTVVNGALLKLMDVIQSKLHPETHVVKALPRFYQRVSGFVSGLLPSGIWSRRRVAESGVNSDAAPASRCCPST